MTVLERIKSLCREKKNISITTLEQTLGYSNGSLAKAKDIPSSRIAEISIFLNVSIDYLMTGKEHETIIEMADIDSNLIFMEKRLKEYALKLSNMPKEKQEHVMSLIDMLEEKGE